MLTASTTMGAVPLTTSTTPLVSSTVHQTVFRLRFDSAVTRLTPVTTTTSVTTGTLPWYIYQTPLVEIINTTRVTIGAPYDCDGYLLGGRELRPNPDISGVGVVFAFMLSAWLVWLITVYAFARGQIDASQVTSADTRFFRVQVKSSGWRWSSVFLRAILVFSDQQLVTGIAIMIATFASCQDISVWHYAFAVSLAWLSSNLHLAALLLLRGFLRERPRYLWLRLSGMVLLYILIMVALIPMYMTVVQDATFSHPPPGLLIPEAWSGSGSIRLWTDAQEIPVRCFWKLVYDPRIHPETAAIQQGDSIMYMYSGTRFLDYRTVLSALLLTFVFFWRMLSMFDRSRNRFQRACVSIPSALLEVCRQKAIKKTATLPFYGQALYFGIMCLYTAHIVLWDFLNSFAGTLWLITLNLANGTAQIINLRKERHRNRHDEESSWTFGQIVPIVLLVSPLVAAFEDLLSKRSRRALREGSVGNTSLNEVDLTPEPSLTEATTLSLHTRPLIYSVPTSITQSSIASQKSSGTPAQDLIRSSWPYAILFWELHVLLAFMVIWLPLAQSQLFIFRYAYWEAYYAFPAAVGTFWLTVVIAVPFSSIGRSSYPCPKPRRSGLNVA